jgi:hypothetical protein
MGPELDVADVKAKLDATELAPEAKDAVLDTILRIRRSTSLQAVIEVTDAAWVGGTRVDGRQPVMEPAWPLTQVDDHTVLLRTPCCGVQVWQIQPASDGFRMKALSPASSEVEAFVRSILFESGPFMPAS